MGPQPPIGGGTDPTPRTVLLKRRVNPTDADAISDFLAEVRKALAEQGTKPISVVLVKTEELE